MPRASKKKSANVTKKQHTKEKKRKEKKEKIELEEADSDVDDNSDMEEFDIKNARADEDAIDQVGKREEKSRKLVEDIIIVHPDERKTSQYASRYEIAELISIRAIQLQKGFPAYVDTNGIQSEIDQAGKELRERKCPLCVMRKVGNKYEIWPASELIIDFTLN